MFKQLTTKKHRRPGFDRRMSKDEINACPITRYEGPVSIIKCRRTLTEAIEQLQGETVLGFDTETRPAFKKGQYYPPALLQLAHAEGVLLFQLKHLGLPRPIIQILTDPQVIKTGVSLKFDIQELQKLTPFQPDGFVDLANIAKKQGIKNHGLRGLAAVVLGNRISKSAQRSNWSKDALSPAQIRYAATDAWIGRELYKKLMS